MNNAINRVMELFSKFSIRVEKINDKYNKLNQNCIFTIFIHYIFPIFLLVLITIYYFQSLFGLNGVLAYNDYVLPKTLQDLNAYLSNITIYNINTNLGSVRSNFFSEVPTLLIIKFLSLIFDYQFSTKLTQVFTFAMSGISFYLVLRKINKNTILSFLLSLIIIFNLWSFDRLQQGHFYLLGSFLMIFVVIIYYKYFSNKNYKYLLLGHLLFLSLFTYYHYAIIVVYLFLFDFIFEIILSKERIHVLKGNIMMAIIFGIDSLVYLFPYAVSALNTFKNLSQNISNASDLRLFSWQSMAISEFFHIRLGMYSFALNKNDGFLFLIILGFVGLYYFFFYGESEKKYKDIEFRLKSAFLFFGFLAFGIWLNFEIFANFVYKIPLFAVFRDMNKFVGISFILFVFVISIKVEKYFNNIVENKIKIVIFIVSILFFVSSLFIPYNMFLVYNQDEIYNFEDKSIFTVVSFPSYPITGVYFNNIYFHKYLPSLVATNELRTISIPYLYQQNQLPFQTEIFKDIYKKFENLSKEQIYDKFSNYGVKYFIYYKRYQFITKVPEIDNWYHSIDIQKKLGSDEVIFDNNDVIVYKLPDKYIKTFVNSSNSETHISYTLNNFTEVDLFIKTKDSFTIQQLVNQDDNWVLELVNDSHKSICTHYFSEKINECILKNINNFNLFDHFKTILGYENKLGEKIQNKFGTNEWKIDLNEIENNPLVKRNEDGMYEFRAKIKYLPNSYFIVGVYIFLLNILITILVIYKYNKHDKNWQKFNI